MIVILLYTGIQRRHTFTLADRGSTKVKQEQIQPLFGTVKVSGDCDTDVVFTDIETGERYVVGYITKCRRKAPCFSNGDIRRLLFYYKFSEFYCIR